jgi:hypothetical protein
MRHLTISWEKRVYEELPILSIPKIYPRLQEGHRLMYCMRVELKVKEISSNERLFCPNAIGYTQVSIYKCR